MKKTPLVIHTTDALKQQLRDAAAASGRSLAAETEYRLARSIPGYHAAVIERLVAETELLLGELLRLAPAAPAGNTGRGPERMTDGTADDLDLSDEEAEALARLLHESIEADRYPLSPRVQAWKAILDKIRPAPPREPAHDLWPPRKSYQPPRASPAQRRRKG